MSKRLSYIFLLFSLLIIVSHNITAHHHHSDFAVSQNSIPGDSENDDDHNIFSYGQLDEAYLHSNDQVLLDNDFVFLFDIQSAFSFYHDLEISLPVFGNSESCSLPAKIITAGNYHRGPPTC